MKQFLAQHRKGILAQAIYSSVSISLFLYIIVRTLSYEFPMTWTDEIALFTKIIFTGSFLLVLITTGCAGIYMSFQRMKRSKNIS